MSSLLSTLGTVLNSIGEGNGMRDYQHAARTFVDSLYRLAPKQSTLFHVFLDLNQSVANGSIMNQTTQIEAGLMAKQVSLPRFTIQNKTYNAYNRKVVQQEKINYDPVNITFHDDSADVVLNLWKDYYSYYYRDSDYKISDYDYNSKYQQRTIQNWGFTPRLVNNDNQTYINSIQIYSLHQHRFSSYTLMRPIIQSFQHGQHTYGEYDPIEHQMTVAYEGVLYSSGTVSGGAVQGFDQIHYDNTPSPLSGAAGIARNAADLLNGLQAGDLGASLSNGLGLVNGLTNPNSGLKLAPTFNLQSIGSSILKGQNSQSTIFAPTSADVAAGLSTASAPVPNSYAAGYSGFTPTDTSIGSSLLDSSAQNQNINSQNTQTGDSNQGTPSDQAVVGG